MPHDFDAELSARELQSLDRADAIAAWLARLGYDTNTRVEQRSANLGIPDAVARSLKRVEAGPTPT